MKKHQNDEKDRRRRGFRRPRCIVCPAAKPSMKLPSRRLWLRPSRFSSRKDQYRRPRAGFCEGEKKRNPLAPHSGTFNGGKGDTPVFLFAEYGYGRPFSVSERQSGSRQASCCPRAAPWRTWRGSPESAAKTSPPPPFGSTKTAANNTSESALNRP